ncbi:MAG: nitrate reductase cytochrome c-type subunit [Geminicoccaceae bacterium]
MQKIVIAAGLLIAMAASALAAEPDIATLRSTALEEHDEAPRMMPEENTDLRKSRNYPEQPPIIPHKIEGYQVDMRVNKCLTCHSRNAIEDSQAPMVSITHFMDRDGQFLASISPRRYFCNQCHVPQHEVKPLIDNDFVDVDTLIGEGQ